MNNLSPRRQDREDAMLRGTDYAFHPYPYIHLTRILTLHLLFAPYYVCLLFLFSKQ